MCMGLCLCVHACVCMHNACMYACVWVCARAHTLFVEDVIQIVISALVVKELPTGSDSLPLRMQFPQSLHLTTAHIGVCMHVRLACVTGTDQLQPNRRLSCSVLLLDRPFQWTDRCQVEPSSRSICNVQGKDNYDHDLTVLHCERDGCLLAQRRSLDLESCNSEFECPE